MSERDEHFKGSAKLLWDKLMMVSGGNYGWIDVADDGLDSELIETYKTIIAQYAYDLVKYTIDLVPHLVQRFPDLRLSEEVVARIPDLAEWPHAEDTTSSDA